MMRKILFILICFLPLLTSCGTPNTKSGSFEEISRRHCGIYELSEVFWAGNALDINQDHIAHWNLLQNEFAQLWGFHTLNHKAQITMEPSREDTLYYALNIICQIPYPIFHMKNKKYENPQISYLPLKIKLFYKNDSHLESEKQYQQTNNNITDLFLRGISEIYVSEITSEKFVVSVSCNMYNWENQERQTNKLYYIFQKRE